MKWEDYGSGKTRAQNTKSARRNGNITAYNIQDQHNEMGA